MYPVITSSHLALFEHEQDRGCAVVDSYDSSPSYPQVVYSNMSTHTGDGVWADVSSTVDHLVHQVAMDIHQTCPAHDSPTDIQPLPPAVTPSETHNCPEVNSEIIPTDNGVVSVITSVASAPVPVIRRSRRIRTRSTSVDG